MNKRTSRYRRNALWESYRVTGAAPSVGDEVITPAWDTTIRYFGDSNTGEAGSNPSTWDSNNFTTGWPFTDGIGTTSEYEAFTEVHGSTAQRILESARSLTSGNLGTEVKDAPWISIELFNSQLPVTWTSYDDYPLYSPARSLVSFNIDFDALASDVTNINSAFLDLTVIGQTSWPSGGITAEIFLAEDGTDEHATWTKKNQEGAWADNVLQNPFLDRVYGGHGPAGACGGGATGGVASVEFRIPDGLSDGEVISVDVKPLIDELFNGTYTSGVTATFLIRARYYRADGDSSGPHDDGEPSICDYLELNDDLCSSPIIAGKCPAKCSIGGSTGATGIGPEPVPE